MRPVKQQDLSYLNGLPHPSGANAERIVFSDGNKLDAIRSDLPARMKSLAA
jgi:hypothetical protein